MDLLQGKDVGEVLGTRKERVAQPKDGWPAK